MLSCMRTAHILLQVSCNHSVALQIDAVECAIKMHTCKNGRRYMTCAMPCLSKQTQSTKCNPPLAGSICIGTTMNSRHQSAVSHWSMLHCILRNLAPHVGSCWTLQYQTAYMHSNNEMAQLAMWSDSQQYPYLVEANVGRYGRGDVALKAR